MDSEMSQRLSTVSSHMHKPHQRGTLSGPDIRKTEHSLPKASPKFVKLKSMQFMTKSGNGVRKISKINILPPKEARDEFNMSPIHENKPHPLKSECSDDRKLSVYDNRSCDNSSVSNSPSTKVGLRSSIKRQPTKSIKNPKFDT